MLKVRLEGTPLSITVQKGSVDEAVAVAFCLVEEAALLPQVTGKRDSHGFSKAGRVLPACQGCSKLAPVPAVLAVPHPQTMEPSISDAFRRESAGEVVQHFLTASAALPPAPWFVPAAAGMSPDGCTWTQEVRAGPTCRLGRSC